MLRIKKRLSALFVAFSLLSALAGCGNGKAEAPTGAAPDLSGQTLSVVSPFGSGDGYQAAYLGLVADFEEQTGCAVNDVSEKSSEQWKLGVLSSFENGSEPDVVFFFTGPSAEKLIEQGKVIPLKEIRKHYPDYALNINPSVLSAMKAGDDMNYCVPVTGFWEGLYINRDLFDEHEIKVPESIDELYDAITGFNAAGIIPISANLNTTPHYWFEYLLYNYTGPSAHNSDISEAKLRDCMRDALEMLKALYSAGAFPPDLAEVTDGKCAELFVNKEAAMMLDGSWSSGIVLGMEDVEVTHMPSDASGRRSTTDIIGGFSMGYYITKKGWEENRDASVAFVGAMTGVTALSAFNINGSASPGPMTENAELTDFVRSANSFVSSATAFTGALQDSFVQEAREYLFSNILGIIEGRTDMDSVLDQFFLLNEK